MPSDGQGLPDVQPGLHVPAPTVSDSDHDDPPAAPARSHPRPQSLATARRTQHDASLGVPGPACAPRSPPHADDSTPEQPAPPSPVPTEIVPPDLTQEEIVAEIQQAGIKVRDYAHANPVPVDHRAPELFDPILAWHVYESMLDNPNPDRSALNPRHLRRLLDLGWVSEATDRPRWLNKDREALDSFDSRPQYPWKAHILPQPNKDDLRDVATSRFQWVNAEQLVPPLLGRGIARIAAVFRGSRTTSMRYQKRPVNDATEPEQQRETSPRLKKRRLSDAEPAPSGSQTSHQPLMLLNGKPSEHRPAGIPSATPPRPHASPGPSLSRSLQRHLSMASVSSPCATDLSRSTSRTTLAQGAESD